MNLKRHMCDALRGHLSGGKARFSPAGLPLWQAFVSLSSARGYNPGGPNPISYPEIEAWCRLMRVPLEPRHVEVITAMDAVWLEHAYSRTSTDQAPRVSSHALNPGLFDAVFG